MAVGQGRRDELGMGQATSGGCFYKEISVYSADYELHYGGPRIEHSRGWARREMGRVRGDGVYGIYRRKQSRCV